MELSEKLSILGAAAKYDASCATSKNDPMTGYATKHNVSHTTSINTKVPAGIYHSWTEDGRCVPLLKVLFSNVCRFDCAYCVNRHSVETMRTSFTVDELVQLTIEFYTQNYIKGLFLSSGIFSDPDIVMEKLIQVARTLRQDHGFGGYIHLKIIPGASQKSIQEAGRWADRLSANIELPTSESLQKLAPQKNGKIIFNSMAEVSQLSNQFEEDRKKIQSLPPFAPAGQSTQLIVGASPEDDSKILNLSEALYHKYGLRRVYYSAFIPPGVQGRGGIPDPRLPAIVSPPLVREHRLYQADWLLRFYKFKTNEILDPEHPYLDPHLDPKTAWALRHLDIFPVDVQHADYELLLRVPGIGAKSARRIIEQRRNKTLTLDTLRVLGVTMKRARYFITLGGPFLETLGDPVRLRRAVSDSEWEALQLPLFEF